MINQGKICLVRADSYTASVMMLFWQECCKHRDLQISWGYRNKQFIAE